MILVFDTETTGFVHRELPPEHPLQPRLVQLGGLLMEDDGLERSSMNLIVRPDGYEIPSQASKIHGITTEMAMRVGVPLRLAVASFTNLRALAQATAAHNEEFDCLVMDASIYRCGGSSLSAWSGRRICTMREATDLVGLPPTEKMRAAGFDKFKPPNLQELHRFLFGVSFDGAHDAMVDVRACARCLLELRKRGLCL